MKIGCFALIQPFAAMSRQFELIREMGIEYADLTDNHNGGCLGVEYGFTASVSLDSHPERIRSMARAADVRLSSFCAHANLLDPPSPDVYGTTEIIKAVRLAHLLGIHNVITTEGDPKTAFGHNLTHEQRLFAIRERLQAPIEWARELGVQLLIETHGIVTSQTKSMAELLDQLGCEDVIGLCLDTGNAWLGGSDPLDYIRRFGSRIKHVHWKDIGESWLERRGTVFGCGMATIALGDGLVGVRSIVDALIESGFDGDTTLEIAGVDNVKRSVQRLEEWTAIAANSRPLLASPAV
jgi:inosose dehydratase